MLRHYLLALLLPPLLLLGWLGVQSAWRRRFGAIDADGDVLAGRGDCRNCGCSTPCEKRAGETAADKSNLANQTGQIMTRRS